MGRPKKFGEKSRFVSVRVPGSKVLEYRAAIKKLVDEKFSLASGLLPQEEENTTHSEKESVIFRDFREFGDNVEEGEVGNIGAEDDFFTKIVKEVDNRGKNGKEIK